MNYCSTCGTKGCKQHIEQPIGSVNLTDFIVTRYTSNSKKVDIKGHSFEIDNVGNTHVTVGKWEIEPCTAKTFYVGSPLNPVCKVLELCFGNANIACECKRDENGDPVLDDEGNPVLAALRNQVTITSFFLDHPKVRSAIGV